MQHQWMILLSKFFEKALLNPQKISHNDLLGNIRPSNAPSELFNPEMLSNRDLIRQVYTYLIENGFKVKPYVPPATGYAIKLVHVIYPGDAFKQIRDNTIRQVRVILQDLKKTTPVRLAMIYPSTSRATNCDQGAGSKCPGEPFFSRSGPIPTQSACENPPYKLPHTSASTPGCQWPKANPLYDPYKAQKAQIEANIRALTQQLQALNQGLSFPP